MNDDPTVFHFDDSGIKNLLKAMESDHFLRVGVFGGDHKKAGEKKAAANKFGGRKKSKESTGMTNAEVGFLCEFGRPKLGNRPKVPARSWLRTPIINHINDIAKECQVQFEDQIKDGDSVKFLKYMGVRVEAYIQMAFDEHGPGWDPNTPYTIAEKGSAAPNIDTGQLRRAVATEVI